MTGLSARRLPRLVLLAAAVAAAIPLRAQDPSVELVTFEAEQKQARLQFEHDALLTRLRALATRAKGSTIEASVQARLAAIALEAELLQRLQPLAELRAAPLADTLARLEKLPLRAPDYVTLATFATLADARQVAEDALGQARERDEALKNVTDQALAELRREDVPQGGYHRYRGAWLALDARDRARALDDAFAALARVARAGDVKLPLAVRDDVSNDTAFAALGTHGPTALRTAAATLRQALTRRYDTVRGYCASYANARARTTLLDLDQRSRERANAARERIKTYDKPEQHEVDAFRADLLALTGLLDTARTQDRHGYTTATPADATRLRDEIAGMEQALRCVDDYFARAAQPALEPFDQVLPANAATSPTRVLQGRSHSALEDSMWFLLGARTGMLGETIGRADELMRRGDQLTPWERLLIEDLRDDAVQEYGREVAATGLDAQEREFLATLNAYRRLLRLRCLEPDERLVRSARKHSEEMVRLRYFGHVSPIGSRRTPTLRANLEGFAGGVGENCLSGSVSGAGAFEGWYRSPGHHRNLIGDGPILGIGATADHAMWTMVIGGGDTRWRLAHRDTESSRRSELATHVLHTTAALKTRKRQRPPSPEDPGLLPELLRQALPPCYETNGNDKNIAAELLRLAVACPALPEQRPLLEIAAATAKERLDLDLTLPPLLTSTKVVAQPELSVPGRGDGPSLKAPLKLLSKSERQRLARQFGGGPRTERMVERGLVFLANCQDADGAWRAHSFADLVPGMAQRNDADRGKAEWELAMTGLALLCYVTTGSSPHEGEYATQVDRGTRFLMAKLLDYGRFESGASHYMYSHALATQALCEAYAYTADPLIGTYAQLAVDYLVAAQHRPSGGWRYEPDQSGDTSVVGWVVMALNSAHKAHLDVGGFRDAVRFLDSVTENHYYRVGYTSPSDDHIFGNRLASVAMTSRRFLGAQTSDPRLQWPAIRMAEDLPRADRPDYYYWYYGTLAMFQMGGDFWRAWSESLTAALLDLHVEKQGQPIDGSFGRDRHYSDTGGRLYSTTMAILCATAWYRYDRAPKAKVLPFTGDIDQAIAPFLAVLADPPNDTVLRVTEAKFADAFGPYAVVGVLRALATERKQETARRLARLIEQVAEPMNEGALLQNLGVHADVEVRKTLMRALERVCSPKSQIALLDALATDKNGHVRGLAARMLGGLGASDALTALNERLAVEPDPWAKEQIQNALHRIASQNALDQLVATAVGNAPGRPAVRSSLQLLERDQLADRIGELADTQPKLHKRVVEVIGKERELSTLPVLIVLLDADAEAVRTSAFGLLVALTQQKFGYDATHAAAARTESIKRWLAFWDEQQHRYGGQGKKTKK